LFNRSLGETAEIVQKQMFLVRREDDVYALRPEGTAPIVRAYIENCIDKSQGFVKFYYMGPMFRAERPQKGRLRQFHHIGCEAIGSYGPGIDAEAIALADTLLKAYGIKGYSIALNSLGCQKDQHAFRSWLKEKIGSKISSFCDDCKTRFERNIMRVLDCKNEPCRSIIKEMDIKGLALCPECQEHFSGVRRRLDVLNIGYEIWRILSGGLIIITAQYLSLNTQGLVRNRMPWEQAEGMMDSSASLAALRPVRLVLRLALRGLFWLRAGSRLRHVAGAALYT